MILIALLNDSQVLLLAGALLLGLIILVIGAAALFFIGLWLWESLTNWIDDRHARKELS